MGWQPAAEAGSLLSGRSSATFIADVSASARDYVKRPLARDYAKLVTTAALCDVGCCATNVAHRGMCACEEGVSKCAAL